MKQFTFNQYPIYLVESVDELPQIRASFSEKVMCGVDTETKGLTYQPDMVAGVCVSGGTHYGIHGYAGYYLPLRHVNYENNLPVDAVIHFVQDIIDNFTTVFFHRNFDLSMLEYDGLKVPFVGGMHDAQIMAYLTWNEKPEFVTLKAYAHKLLKWDVIEFEEITGGNHDFSQSDPRQSYTYAAGDPIMTVMLSRKLWSSFPYIRKIYPLDNMATEAVRRMTQQTFHLNREIIRNEYDRVMAQLQAIKEQIYTMTGVQGFNINSTRDKVNVLSRFVTLTKKTKKGGIALDEDTLRELNHPIATLFADYLKISTYSKFLTNMVNMKDPLHGNYNLCVVPSGRYSSSASKGNEYFAPMNMQNVVKKEEKLFLHRHPFLGYCLTREKDGCVCNKDGDPIMYKTKTGLHEAFITRNSDWVWLTADYAAQEMKLAANFSHEPTLLEPLQSGKDIHTHTAMKMFGYSDPNHRTNVKIMNFQCLYGAEAPTIANFLKCTLGHAQELMAKYKLAMSQLYKWKAAVIAEAKRTGLTFTYFGRPVYVHKYFTSSTYSLSLYADRLSVNAKIQGCLPFQTYVHHPSKPNMICTYVEATGYKVQYGVDETGKRHYGIPTNRGTDMMHFLLFNTGDFVVCSSQHKFLCTDKLHLVGLPDLAETNKPPRVILMPTDGRKRVILAILHLFRHPFKTPTLGRLLTCWQTIDLNDERYITGFFKAWLLRKKIDLSPLNAHTLRSIADMFGYNLVSKRGRFRLKWGRRSKAYCVAATTLDRGGCVSPTMVSGFQTYPLMGFIHKNTGGDLIRMDSIKFEKLREIDPEWRENTSFQLTVHDEMNFEVQKGYLYKAWKRTLKVMNYSDKNLIIPITVDTGVGTHWGNCLDFICCSLDNRIVPKDLAPDMLDGDERGYLLDIIGHCRKRDLPEALREFTEIE